MLDVGEAFLRTLISTGRLDAELAEAVFRFDSFHASLVGRCGSVMSRIQLYELREAGSDQLPPNRESYLQMIGTIQTAEWLDYICQTYERVGDFIVAIESEIGFITDALEKYQERRDLLFTKFGIAYTPEVRDVCILGDSHNGGKHVIQIVDEAGNSVMYKPHDCGPDVFYSSLLVGYNAFLRRKLILPKYVRDEGGFWQEYLSSNQQGPVTLDDFYRLGSWLALAYWTGLIDIHRENVLWTSHGPTLVDLECCFTAYKQTENSALQYEPEYESIGAIGILPMLFSMGDADEPINWGVLSRGNPSEPRAWATHLFVDEGLPTVRMVESTEVPDVAQESAGKSARFDAEISDEFQEALIEGFLDGTEYFRKCSISILGEAVTSLVPSVRLLRRPTQQYGNVIRRGTYPNHMRSREEFRDTVMVWLSEHDPNTELLMQKSEIADLLSFDVPAFYVKPEANHIADIRLESGLTRVIEHLELLKHTSTLDQELRYICQAFESLKDIPRPTKPTFNRRTSMSPKQLISEMAETICATKRSSGGKAVWTDLLRSETGRWAVRPTDFSLYNGLAGYYLTIRSLIESRLELPKAVERTCTELEEQLVAFWRESGEIPMGVFNGGSGILYSLASFATADCLSGMDFEDFFERAESAIPSMGHDVISGVSGLMVLAERLRSRGVNPDRCEDIQRRCLIRLDDLCSFDKEGLATWESADSWYGGFSHGTAGIIWACEESSLVSRRKDSLKLRAWNSQRTLLCDDGVRWFRTSEKTDNDICAWCHGTEGILFALRPSSSAETLYRHQLRYLASGELPDDICLCHGLAGRAMSLYALGCENVSDTVFEKLLSASDWLTSPMTCLDDSLMTGRSGVVQALLHRYVSQNAPNPLLLQMSASALDLR